MYSTPSTQSLCPHGIADVEIWQGAQAPPSSPASSSSPFDAGGVDDLHEAPISTASTATESQRTIAPFMARAPRSREFGRVPTRESRRSELGRRTPRI